MWTKLLFNGGALLSALPVHKIMLYSIVMLLGATLVLGTLLKREIEHSGRQEALLNEAYRGQASLRLSLDKEKESCRETVAILDRNLKIKEQSDKATAGLIRQVHGVLYERDKAGNSGKPDALLKLLDSATCQARNNGIPCSTNHSSK